MRAISNLKIDKITVWDQGSGANGKNATADFLSGLVGALPPLHELTKNVSVRLPEYLGSMAEIATNGAAGEPPSDAPDGSEPSEPPGDPASA